MRHFHTLLAAATAFSLQAQVPSYVPTNGLVGWWPFSGNANDESGTGNNGVVFGPTLALDRFGNVNQAYGFNGLSDYIEIMDDASLDLENELSISVWFNTNDYTLPQYIINKSSNGTSDSWLLDLSANPVNESEIRMLVGGLTSNLPYSDPIIFSNGQWYHVLCTYDLQFVRFYVNGALVTSFPVSTATPSNSNNVRISAPFQPWGQSTDFQRTY
ncbi:MAG: LamG domain-containing protein [Flavobacteriales bacterium]|nr:LamG domain-containing protein [Flavobacteriales bacterium]